MDAISVSALIIAVLGASAAAIATIHMTKCQCCGITSDCVLNDDEKIERRVKEINKINSRKSLKEQTSTIVLEPTVLEHIVLEQLV